MPIYGGPGLDYDPDAHAEALGLRIIERRLRRPRWGEYHDAERTVVLHPDMTRRARRCILAHECQHGIYRDVPTIFGPINDGQERRARLGAARLLVSPVEYALAEALYGPNDAAIAAELDVIPEVLADWRIAVRTVGVQV